MALKILYFVAGVLLRCSPLVSADKHDENLSYRLPNNVHPISYNLNLLLDTNKNMFQGLVKILLHVTAPTSSIVIHARELVFRAATISDMHAQEIMDVSLEYAYESYDYWILKPERGIEAGVYELAISYIVPQFYSGYGSGGGGLFMVNYEKNDSNDTDTMIIAIMENSGARAVFPCFDEFSYKATFEMTVAYTKRPGYYALSNMDVVKNIDDGDFRLTIFKKSPPMSTSALGLVISNLVYTRVRIHQDGIGEPFDLRIHIQEDLIEFTEFHLNYSKRVMEYLIEYTNVPYPLSKLDLVAIRSPFWFEKTASWGLGCIGEMFLSESDDVKQNLKLRAMREIASLVAKMWFGNLVTPSWWDHYWLTGELSTFMSWKAMTAIFPNLTEQVHLDFLDLVSSAKLNDHSGTAEPLMRTVDEPLTEYDTGRSGKGFSLLVMAESVLTSERFRKAIKNYLTKYEFRTATTSDLTKSLRDVNSGMHLTKMMQLYTTSSNLPTLTVSKLVNGSFLITQTFYTSYPDDDDFFGQEPFVIPVTYVSSSKSGTLWIRKFEHILDNLEADWLKINVGGLGYYSTNYSENLWLTMAQALYESRSILEPVDRDDILRTVYSQIENYGLRYDTAFELLRFLEYEQNVNVWRNAIVILNDIQDLLIGDALVGFRRFGQQIIGNYYRSLEWTIDSLRDAHLQEVFKFACTSDLEDCLTFSQETFKEWYMTSSDFTKINEVVAVAGMKTTTNESVWQNFWVLFDKDPNRELFAMLTTSKDSQFLTKVLRRMATKGLDNDYLYSDILRRMTHVDPRLVWTLLMEHLSDGSSPSQYHNAFETVLLHSVDPELATQMIGPFAPGSTLSSAYNKANENAVKMAPAKKWLRENHFLESQWKLVI